MCFGAAEDENGRSVAQELADISKKRVKAATGYFRINIDGSYYVGSDIGLSDGAMVVIEPGIDGSHQIEIRAGEQRDARKAERDRFADGVTLIAPKR